MRRIVTAREQWEMTSPWRVAAQGVEPGMPSPYIARGIHVDLPEDDHDLFHAIAEHRATPQQLLRLAGGEEGRAGSYWGVYAGNDHEYDEPNAYGLDDVQGYAGWGDADDTMPNNVIDTGQYHPDQPIYSQVPMVLVGQRPYRGRKNKHLWDPEIDNDSPDGELMGNSFLRDREKVPLKEIHYHSGKGWVRVPMDGSTIRAFRVAAQGVEPGMNLPKQLRKIDQAIEDRRRAGDHEKADYLTGLRAEMAADAEAGEPRPWSWYQPRVEEEFSDRTSSRRQGGAEDGPGRLYRGMWVIPERIGQEATSGIHKMLDTDEHDPAAVESLLDAVNEDSFSLGQGYHQGIGDCWSTHPDVAEKFAHGGGGYLPGGLPTGELPKGYPGFAVMMEGSVNPAHIDPHSSYLNENYPDEHETRLLSNAPVTLHGLSVRRSRDEPWTNLLSSPRQMNASRRQANPIPEYDPFSSTTHLHLSPDEVLGYSSPDNSWSKRKKLPALADDIARNGVREPVSLTTNGQHAIIDDGHHRAKAAQMAGLDSIPVRLGYDRWADEESGASPVGPGLAAWLSSRTSSRRQGTPGRFTQDWQHIGHDYIPTDVLSHYMVRKEEGFGDEKSPLYDLRGQPPLSQQIKDQGYEKPVSLCTDGRSAYIEDGHHRIDNARQNGLSHVPTVVTWRKPDPQSPASSNKIEPWLKGWLTDMRRGRQTARRE